MAPRTVSVVENMMRELGRRVKKLGYNWSDPGIVRIAKTVLIRRYDPDAWEAYWKERLNLRDRCRITISGIERRRAA